MERAVALSKIKKLLGPNAYWRIGAALTSPERRSRVKIEKLEHEFQVAVFKREMNERSRELVEGDPQYQASKAAWLKHSDELKAMERRDEGGYRFEVGTSRPLGGMFTCTTPKAYGDTWEEVFAKLEAPKSTETDADALARHNRELAATR